MSMLSLAFLVLLNLAIAATAVDEYSKADFPPGFVFGAGTSAYQVEGAVDEDGRSPSVYDTFTHQGGMRGQTADVAVDQYHKYKEDVQLMVQTGLEAYRFSIAWPRLIPNGRGSVNPKGLEYYNNLINELVSNGIEPHVTLFHYDLPQILEDEYGGWLSRKIVEDFTAYADVCFREFGDRVKHWTTLNEPNALALFAYDAGMLPPCRCSLQFSFMNCSVGNSSVEPYLVAHHAVLAHASAARLYQRKYQAKQNGSIGCSVLTMGIVPSTNSTADIMAAERAQDFFVGLLIHPLVYGDYPEIVKKNAGSRLPVFTEQEAKLVKGSFDFLGVIHYNGLIVKDYPERLNWEPRDVFSDMATDLFLMGANSSHGGGHADFPLMPGSMKVVLDYFKKTYGNPPIYILENGQMTPHNASLDDYERVEYLHGYIGTLLDSIRDGSNVKGYFVWSFLDLFELLSGWDAGFGLYYVDLDDPELQRYPKLSAHWYAKFISGERVSSDAIIQLKKSSPSLTLPQME